MTATIASSPRTVTAPRTDAPTRILPDGTQQWLNADGMLHREDGPAEVRPDGILRQLWFVNGALCISRSDFHAKLTEYRRNR